MRKYFSSALVFFSICIISLMPVNLMADDIPTFIKDYQENRYETALESYKMFKNFGIGGENANSSYNAVDSLDGASPEEIDSSGEIIENSESNAYFFWRKQLIDKTNILNESLNESDNETSKIISNLVPDGVYFSIDYRNSLKEHPLINSNKSENSRFTFFNQISTPFYTPTVTGANWKTNQLDLLKKASSYSYEELMENNGSLLKSYMNKIYYGVSLNSDGKVSESTTILSPRVPSSIFSSASSLQKFVGYEVGGSENKSDSMVLSNGNKLTTTNLTYNYKGTIIDEYRIQLSTSGTRVQSNQQKKGSKKTVQGTFQTDSTFSKIGSILACNSKVNPNGYSSCHYRAGSVTMTGDITGGVYFPNDYLSSSVYTLASYSTSSSEYNILCDANTTNCNDYGMRRNNYVTVKNTMPTAYDAQYWKACTTTDTFWNESKNGFGYNFSNKWTVGSYILDYQDESNKKSKILKRVVSQGSGYIYDYNSDNKLIRKWKAQSGAQILNMPPVIWYSGLTVGDTANDSRPNMITTSGDSDTILNCNGEYLKAYFLSILQETIKDSDMYDKKYQLTSLYSSPSTSTAINALSNTSNGTYNTGRRKATERDSMTTDGIEYERFINYWAKKIVVQADSRIQDASIGTSHVVGGHWYYNHFTQSNFSIATDMFVSRFTVYDSTGSKLGELARSLSAKSSSGFLTNAYSSGFSSSNAPATVDNYTDKDHFIDISSLLDDAFKSNNNTSADTINYDPCTTTSGTSGTTNEDTDTYTPIPLKLEAEVEYISWYHASESTLVDGYLEPAEASKTKATDEQKAWGDNASYSGNPVVGVIFGTKTVGKVASITKRLDTTGAFTDNGNSYSVTDNNFLSNMHTVTLTKSIEIPKSVAEKMIKGKMYRVNVHINRGHSAVGDDSVADNSYQYFYLINGDINTINACASSNDGTNGAYLVDANDITKKVSYVGSDGSIDSSKLEIGKEYRLVLDIKYTGGVVYKYDGTSYLSTSSSSGSTHGNSHPYSVCDAWDTDEETGETQCTSYSTEYRTETHYFPTNKLPKTYYEYNYAFNGKLTVSQFTGEDISSYYQDSDEISSVEFDNKLGIMTKYSPIKSLYDLIDESKSVGITKNSTNKVLLISGKTDSDTKSYKYVSKAFTAESMRVMLDYQTEKTESGNPWDYGMTVGNGVGETAEVNGQYEDFDFYDCQLGGESSTDYAESYYFENQRPSLTGGIDGTKNSINDLVFIDDNYKWDVVVENLEVLPKVEMPTEEKMINLSVKYDINYKVPSNYTLTPEQTMYVLIVAKCKDEVSTKVEKVSIAPGKNLDISHQLDFYLTSEMSGETIDVSVLANIAPHNVTIDSNGVYKLKDGTIDTATNLNKLYTLTGNGHLQRVFEYSNDSFECTSKLGTILMNNQDYSSVTIQENTDLYEFCKPTKDNKITCDVTMSEKWNQLIQLGTIAFTDKSFKNLIDESRLMYNYTSFVIKDKPKSLEESYKITEVRFKSKMVTDLGYGNDNNWVVIYKNGDNSLNKEAVIKAGYGFELEVDVEYEGPDYTATGNSDSKLSRSEPIAANVWKEIYLQLPDKSTVSMNGSLGGSNAYMKLKANPTYTKNGVKLTYIVGSNSVDEKSDSSDIGSSTNVSEVLDSIKSNSSTTEKEYNKIIIGEHTKNGIYQIKIATPAIMGTVNKSSMWNYSNNVSKIGTGNILCDSIIVKFTVNGTATDDTNTHTGE